MIESLEPRTLLAVTAGVVGSELLIDLSEANDAAVLQVDGSNYAVRSGAETVGSFSAASINSIRVAGDLTQPNQSLFVRPGGVVAKPLRVDAGVDATFVYAPIVTTGDVVIESASLTLAQDVSSSGRQTYSGLVRLANDVVVDAGSAEIRFGGEIRSTVGPRATLMENIGTPFRLAASPDGRMLYASDAVSNFVYFVDLTTQQMSTVDTGKSVGNVALSPSGGRLYVANHLDGSVTALDTQTRQIVGTITGLGTPEGMAFSRDGQSLYVTNYSENVVAVVSVATNRVVRTIAVPGNPNAVAVAPDGRLWVTSETLNRVSVIDLATSATVSQIAVGRGPADIALSPDGSRAFVSINFAGNLQVIDTTTATVSASVGIGPNPTDIVVSPDGRLVYVVNEFSDGITVFDTASRTTATRVPAGSLPAGIVLSPTGRTAYVANLNSLSELGDDARSLTVRTNGIVRFNGSTSTVDPLRELNVQANREIEAAGAVSLTYNSAGNLRANGTVITMNGSPVHYLNTAAAGWTAVAAERIANVNTLLLRHSSGHLTFWRLNDSWVHTSNDGWVAPNTSTYFSTEASFGIDIDGDGAIGLSMLDSAGNVALGIDGRGELRANGTRVTFGGAPVNYQATVAGGWTALAAETLAKGNTIALRHSGGAGHLHYWRLDSSWSQTSGDGWVEPLSVAYHQAETVFANDFDADGLIGLVLTTIESAGTVTLATDANGNLRANRRLVMFNNAPYRHNTAANAEWRAMAADTRGGVNTVVLRHSSGNLHFWRLDASWRQVSADGWVAPGSATFYATELTFGVDLDGNGGVTIEAAGGITLTYDASGNLRANGTAVTFNGSPVNYQGMISGGWTPMAAEVDQAVNTLILRHSSGNLHSWRMNATWGQVSGDGWIAPRTNDFFASEVTFGVDLDSDGVLTIETAGNVIFAYDADGNIRANETLVIFNGGGMNYHRMVEAGWRAMAADIHEGVNTVVLRHASGHLHYWRMSATWTQVGGDGWVAIGSRPFFAAEATFAADLDGDGIRTIEAAGSHILTYDRTGAMRVGTTPVTFNGGPANFFGAVAAGWGVLAAELNQTRNTILLRHIASGHLHFWRFDASWNHVSGDGWVAPGSPELLATETAFGVDINGNRTVGT